MSKNHALALFSVLFVGIAAGCGKEGEPVDSGLSDTGFATCGESDKAGLSGSEAATYCELVTVIMNSGHDEHTRHAVLECLPALSEESREALLLHWQEATSAQVYDEVWALAQSECETTDIADLR